MPEADLVSLVLLPMMSALLHVHQKGFIHRDIKPENTLFGSGRVLKLAGKRGLAAFMQVLEVGVMKVVTVHTSHSSQLKHLELNQGCCMQLCCNMVDIMLTGCNICLYKCAELTCSSL